MNRYRQILGFEGRKRVAYPDPRTKGPPWTIGVGHTGPEVHEGLVWSDQQIDDAYARDLQNAVNECIRTFPWFITLNLPRQGVLVSMMFQMGKGRLLTFVNTLATMKARRWADTARGMLDSKWARQTPERAKALAEQMRTGVWAKS